jgi:hypothetical protein
MKFIEQIIEHAGPGRFDLYTKDGQKKYVWREPPESATVAHIAAHLDGTQPIGINVNRQREEASGRAYSHFLIFDFDDKSGTINETVMRQRVAIVAMAVDKHGLPFFVVRSSGGKGYHIWVVFKQHRRDDVLRKLGDDILATATQIISTVWQETFQREEPGKDTRRGMFNDGVHYIEVFPKNAGACNVALPMAQQSCLMRIVEPTEKHQRFWGIVPDDNPQAFEITFAKARKPGPKSSSKGSGEVDVDAAFKAVRKLRGGLDTYAKWVANAYVLRAAFGADALDMITEWSRESDGFVSDKDVQDKWQKAFSKGTPKAPKEAFWAYARQGGYRGGFPDGVDLTKTEQKRVILEDIIGTARLFKDQDGNAFAQVGPRRTIAIGSGEFSDWLRREAWLVNEMLSNEEVSKIAGTARAHAVETRNVHLRAAQSGSAIYVDLCDDGDRVLRITADGVRVYEDDEEVPVVFRRSKQLPIVWNGEGTLDDLRAMVNIDDDQFVIMCACIVKMFFTASPSPLVNVTGEYGSAKTSTTIVMRSLFDPASAMVSRPRKDSESDIYLRAYHNAVLTLENMADLSHISDTLSAIITGDALETRQFYTVGDLFTVTVRRPIIVNGIDATKYKADLISRMVDIWLSRPTRPWSEEDFERTLREKQALMFNGIVQLLVKVLGIIDDIELPEKHHRLTTFARVAEAVAQIMGKDAGWISAHMAEQQEDAQINALEDDVVYQLMVKNFQSSTKLERRTPAELLDALVLVADGDFRALSRLPKTPSGLSSRLLMLKSQMLKLGWGIEKVRRDWVIKPPRMATPEEIEAMIRK